VEPFDPFVRHITVTVGYEEETVRVELDPVSSPDLATLYLSQRAGMVRLARLLTGSSAVAEDVVQEAFLKMHRATGSPQNPEAYLRTVVTNLSRSHMRHLHVEQRVHIARQVTISDPEIDETWSALCRLPFRQRAVLALRFYEDMTEADIARVLKCRPGTVKSTLHRALLRLRKDLS
jgi:RNA polymerase sigma factor (sigma-70 family)